MNLLMSCIGNRGYLADYFRQHLQPGERIIGTSNTPWTSGFESCDVGVVLPSIETDDYIPAVFDLCHAYEIDAVISLFDPDVIALSRCIADFEAIGVRPLIPNENLARTAFDKAEAFAVLRGLGFPVPETVTSAGDARELLRTGQFTLPLVIKPRCGFGSRNLFVVDDLAHLDALFAQRGDAIVQQHVDGQEVNVDVLADLDGQVLQVVAWRKLESRGGETWHSETIMAPDLVDLGYRLGTALGLVGPMDVDLIRDADGALWVLDVNPRFGGGYPASHHAGADFPRLIVEMLRGMKPAPRIGQYEVGVSTMKSIRPLGGPAASLLRTLNVAPIEPPSDPGHLTGTP